MYTEQQLMDILKVLGFDEFDLNEVLEDLRFCEIEGCSQMARWEGWYSVKDFSRNPTGLIQKRCVCNDHKTLLRGGNNEI